MRLRDFILESPLRKRRTFSYDTTMPPDETDRELERLIGGPKGTHGTMWTINPHGPGGGNPAVDIETTDPDDYKKIRAWVEKENVTWTDEEGTLYDDGDVVPWDDWRPEGEEKPKPPDLSRFKKV